MRESGMHGNLFIHAHFYVHLKAVDKRIYLMAG